MSIQYSNAAVEDIMIFGCSSKQQSRRASSCPTNRSISIKLLIIHLMAVIWKKACCHHRCFKAFQHDWLTIKTTQSQKRKSGLFMR